MALATSRRVYIAVVTRGHPHFMSSAAMAALNGRAGAQPDYVWGNDIPHSRNVAVSRFLALDSTFGHMLFIDDDTAPPADALKKLLALNTDIATGVTPIKRNDLLMANVSNARLRERFAHWFPPLWPTGVFDVDACGTSCMLIRRAVLERLSAPVFPSGDDHDTAFCARAVQAGFTILCDASVRCEHYHIVEIGKLANCHDEQGYDSLRAVASYDRLCNPPKEYSCES